MARSRSTLWRTQNFLPDPKLVERLVRKAEIASTDVVYDLGAGTGALTHVLARRVGRVVAIERDPRLCARLRTRFASHPNVDVREADILRHPLPRSDYVVFASPPFDVTAALVRTLTATAVPPRDAYLALQREAADRYRGEPRQTLAALLLAPWFAVRIVHRFARTDFAPSPSVDVVMIRLHKRGPPLIDAREAQLYRDFVTALFGGRRRDLGRSLAQIVGVSATRRLLGTAHIDPRALPSMIDTTRWLRLFRHFAQLPVALTDRVSGADARLRRQQRRLRKVHRTRVPRDSLWHLRAAMIHASFRTRAMNDYAPERGARLHGRTRVPSRGV